MCPICPLSGVIVTIVCDVGVDPSVSCFINSPHQRHGRGPACLSLVLCSSSCQSMLGLTLVGEGFLSKPWSQRRPDQCLIALCVCGCCVELPGYRGAICDFVALELLRCIMVPRERGRRQVTHKRWETRHTAPSQTEDVGHRPCRHKGRQTYWTGTKTQRPRQTDGWTPPLAVCWGSDMRYALKDLSSISLPSLRWLHTFGALFLGISSPLLCPGDVRRRLRAGCQACPTGLCGACMHRLFCPGGGLMTAACLWT